MGMCASNDNKPDPKYDTNKGAAPSSPAKPNADNNTASSNHNSPTKEQPTAVQKSP